MDLADELRQAKNQRFQVELLSKPPDHQTTLGEQLGLKLDQWCEGKCWWYQLTEISGCYQTSVAAGIGNLIRCCSQGVKQLGQNKAFRTLNAEYHLQQLKPVPHCCQICCFSSVGVLDSFDKITNERVQKSGVVLTYCTKVSKRRRHWLSCGGWGGMLTISFTAVGILSQWRPGSEMCSWSPALVCFGCGSNSCDMDCCFSSLWVT